MQAEIFNNFTAPGAAILVVDDISSNLKVMEYLLEPFRVQVDLCLSGERAVEMVAQKWYDLVFVDHLMPGIDGIETTSRIRAMGGVYEQMVMVALTGNSVSGVREMFIENGLNDFLAKPVDVAKLNVILDIWIPENKKRRISLSNNDAAIHNTHKQQEEAAGFTIEGVDIKLGVYRVGGKLERYIRTVELFCSDARERVEAIRRSFENDDKRSFITHVHALKSAAANIGGMKLSNLAKSLEMAGTQEDTVYIRDNLQIFLDDLQKMIQDCTDALAKEKPPRQEPTISAKDLLVELEALADAIKNFEISETDRLIHNLEKAHLSESIDAISQCVMLSEYDCAISLIEKYIMKVKAAQ